MSIRQRLEKLEDALPRQDAEIRILRKFIVRRDGSGRPWEKPFLVILLRPALHPNGTLHCHPSETQNVFLGWVRDAIGRIDPAEAFDWKPQPGTDHTE